MPMGSSLRRLAFGFFLIALAAAVLLLSDQGRRRAGPSAAVPRIAILQQTSQAIIDEGVEGMIAGLAERGFVDGRTASIRRYNAEGDGPTANTIAKEITGGRYDMVLTATTLSLQAVANANRDGRTNHVFALVSDPFGAGVGIDREDPLRHPPHLAGYGTMQPVEATLRLAKEMNPGLAVVGVPWNPAEANSEANLRIARAVAPALGIDLIEATVENSAGVREAASALVARGARALWIGGDVAVVTAADQVIDVARGARIPVVTSMPGNAAKGALFDLGADYREVGRLAGVLAAEILAGRDPATVEVTNVLPERIIVNQTALAGLEDPWRIPPEVLDAADEVIGENGARKRAAKAIGES